MIDIDISDALTHPGRKFDYTFEGTPDFEGTALNGPLVVRARYALEGNAVQVTGAVEAQLACSCDRCLADTSVDMRETFTELFEQKASSEEAYTFNPETRTLKLDQLVRDLVLAAVPMQILCRPDCKGLCPNCGADLNDGPCECSSDCGGASTDVQVSIEADNPFAVLKDLF